MTDVRKMARIDPVLEKYIMQEHEIEVGKSIGRGTFGNVYQGKLKNGTEVAIKAFPGRDYEKYLISEALSLSKLDHTNIIKLYGICLPLTALVIEYINGYSLYDVIHNEQTFSYDTSMGVDWASQCANGLAYMHNIRPPILHRDFKSLNIVVDSTGRNLRIIDFGTATYLRTLMSKDVGSAIWMAPEVFATSKYTEKCDVFSFGMVLWEIFYRKLPITGSNPNYIKMSIYYGNRPVLIENRLEIIYTSINALIQNCWNKDPKNRPNMKNVVQDLNNRERFPINNINDLIRHSNLNNNLVLTGYSCGAEVDNTYSSNLFQNSMNDTTISSTNTLIGSSSTSMSNDETQELTQEELQKLPHCIRPDSPDEYNSDTRATQIRLAKVYLKLTQQERALSEQRFQLEIKFRNINIGIGNNSI